MGFRGVGMRQGGISDALYTSPSRLDHSPSLEQASSECLSQHTALLWMETAAGSGVGADTMPGPLEPVQCGVTKECRNCGFGSCALINVEKKRKVCMFLRPYAEGTRLWCNRQSLFKTCFSQLMIETLARSEWMADCIIHKLKQQKE